MSKARIMRYGQMLAMLDADPDLTVMICVRREESIDAVVDEIVDSEKDSELMVEMCKDGRIRIVTSIDRPEGRYEHIAMPRDTLPDDALCKVARAGRCIFFQPVNKELPQW